MTIDPRLAEAQRTADEAKRQAAAAIDNLIRAQLQQAAAATVAPHHVAELMRPQFDFADGRVVHRADPALTVDAAVKAFLASDGHHFLPPVAAPAAPPVASPAPGAPASPLAVQPPPGAPAAPALPDLGTKAGATAYTHSVLATMPGSEVKP